MAERLRLVVCPRGLAATPPRLRRLLSDLRPALLAQLLGPRLATLQPAKPAERDGGRILVIAGGFLYNTGGENVYVLGALA